jgi:hypothetical protein
MEKFYFCNTKKSPKENIDEYMTFELLTKPCKPWELYNLASLLLPLFLQDLQL